MYFVPMWESMVDPGGNTDVMLYVVLSLIGLCLEFAALNKVYEWTMSWLRKRAGGNDAHLPSRMQGVVGAVWGGVFVLLGLAVIVPATAPFGVIWTLLAGIFTALDVYQAFIKRYVRARPRDRGLAPEVQRQLALLESLRAAGMMDEKEYWEKRRNILEELSFMKLANALSQRSELQTRIRQLEDRLDNNAQVQEGEQPAEDPMELLKELDADYARLEELISAINRTNNDTKLEDGTTLSDLLARRDCLKGKLSILRGFLNSASALVRRHSVSEIKIKSTVDVRQLQKQVDGLSKNLRELEETIQEKNWTTELM